MGNRTLSSPWGWPSAIEEEEQHDQSHNDPIVRKWMDLVECVEHNYLVS
jgi:hypothetical protein